MHSNIMDKKKDYAYNLKLLGNILNLIFAGTTALSHIEGILHRLRDVIIGIVPSFIRNMSRRGLCNLCCGIFGIYHVFLISICLKSYYFKQRINLN